MKKAVSSRWGRALSFGEVAIIKHPVGVPFGSFVQK
jgi:hypothetical protein